MVTKKSIWSLVLDVSIIPGMQEACSRLYILQFGKSRGLQLSNGVFVFEEPVLKGRLDCSKHGVHIDPAKYERWRAQQTKDAPNHSIVGSGGGGGQDDVVRSEEHRGASISTKLSPTPTANDASIVTDNAETPDAPYPTSFSEIVELINSGKPIQGIKDIPDTVLEGQASQSSKTTRQKPWEKNDSFTADPNLVSDSLSGTQSKGV